MDEALEQQANFIDYFQNSQDYSDQEDVESTPTEEVEPEEDTSEEDSFFQSEEMNGEAFLQNLLSGNVDGHAMGDMAAPMYSAFGTTNVSRAGSIANTIAARESKGEDPYHALPRRKDGSLASSAVGKYQFLWNEHKDWISKITGVHSKEEFMDNPNAQEAAFDYWDKNTLTPTAKKYNAQLPQYSEDELKMMIHFGGEGNLQKAIKSGNFDKPLDSFGSSMNSYIKKRQYGGGDDPKLTTAKETNWFRKSYNKFLSNTPIGQEIQKQWPTDSDKLSAITEGASYIPAVRVPMMLANTALDLSDLNSQNSLDLTANTLNTLAPKKYKNFGKIIGLGTDIMNVQVPEKKSYGGIGPGLKNVAKASTTQVAPKMRSRMLNEVPVQSLDEQLMKFSNDIDGDQTAGLSAIHTLVGKPTVNMINQKGYRANYNDRNNSMKIDSSPSESINDYIAEAAHAYQKKYNPTILTDGLAMGLRALPQDLYDSTAYDLEGSHEYNAHKVIEPILRNGYRQVSGYGLGAWGDEIKTALTPKKQFGGKGKYKFK